MTVKKKRIRARALAGHLKDSAFNHRRTICGLTVLVNSQADADGLCRQGCSVRIKHPAGNIDFPVTCFYYWQAFNAARARIHELAAI